jgi:hypothetical protein
MVAEVGEVVGNGGQVPVVTEVGSGRLAEGMWGPAGLLGGVSFVPPGVLEHLVVAFEFVGRCSAECAAFPVQPVERRLDIGLLRARGRPYGQSVIVGERTCHSRQYDPPPAAAGAAWVAVVEPAVDPPVVAEAPGLPTSAPPQPPRIRTATRIRATVRMCSSVDRGGHQGVWSCLVVGSESDRVSYGARAAVGGTTGPSGPVEASRTQPVDRSGTGWWNCRWIHSRQPCGEFALWECISGVAGRRGCGLASQLLQPEQP